MGLLGTGVYEPVETRVVMACVSEGDIAVDVGANIGWYTTLLSRLVGPRGTDDALPGIDPDRLGPSHRARVSNE